uniref:BTB domain-containing protein n=1 Tax=Panagrolaimus superbus TaxID=310955 RepID=A0A914ZAL2_9BILA
MHFQLNKSNIFQFNLKWKIGLWKTIKAQKDFVAEYKEHFFIFKFVQKENEEFLITIEYSPSDLALIKTVNCLWNCDFKNEDSNSDSVIVTNKSFSNFEISSPVTILHGNFKDVAENLILTFEFTSTYSFITLANIGLPNIDYSKQMLKEYGIKPNCNVVVNEKSFKVHNFMLTAGSDVFEAILNSTKNQKRIDIPDFEPAVVKDAIKFIYGQKPPQAYYQLYRFSTLYRIRQLMDFCELYFEKNLGPNNVIQIYQQSVENNRGHLRHFCVVFYKK